MRATFDIDRVQQRESKTRLLKFLALGTATASLILMMAAPSHAQQGKTIQD
jgi:hypothetical protein